MPLPCELCCRSAAAARAGAWSCWGAENPHSSVLALLDTPGRAPRGCADKCHLPAPREQVTLEPAGMLLGAQLLPSCDRLCRGLTHCCLAWFGGQSGKSSSLYHRDLWFFFSFFILIYLMLPHSMVVSP